MSRMVRVARDDLVKLNRLLNRSIAEAFHADQEKAWEAQCYAQDLTRKLLDQTEEDPDEGY